MKLYDIISHAQEHFPYYTDKFTDNFKIDVIGIDKNVVTCYLGDNIEPPTTQSPHTIIKGGSVYIKEALTLIDIKDISDYNDADGNRLGFIVETVQDHDLSFNQTKHTHIYEHFAQLGGFIPDIYNQKYELLDVPDKHTFMIKTDLPLPDEIGKGQLHAYISYNFWGRYEVIEVDYDKNCFSYIQNNDRSENEIILGKGGIAMANGRITGTCDPLMFYQNTYTKRPADELYAVFSIADVSLSKDKRSESDAQTEIMNGNDYRQRLVTDVRCYIMQSISDDFNGIEATNLAFGEMLSMMVKSFVGSKFQTPMGADSQISPTFMGCSAKIAEKGRYVHEYRLQFVYDITNEDRMPIMNTGAFRHTKQKIKMKNQGVVYGSRNKNATSLHEWDLIVDHDGDVTESFPDEIF